MRAIAILIMLAGCAANAPAPEATMTFRVVGSGQQARNQDNRTTSLAVFDAATMRSVWPAGDPPAIDFEKEMVVILFAGSRPTGGWTIEPRGVSVSAEDSLDVDAAIVGPPPDAFVTQALTSPWVAIAVEKRDVKGIRWHPQ